MELILEEAKKGKYGKTYDRRTICRILKAVKVPKRLQEKYRSPKFKKLPLRNLNRYMERWRKIQWRLTKRKAVRRPTSSLVNAMRRDYLALQPAFEKARHSDKCDKRSRCHKVFGCRHNFLNLNYTMSKLIARNAGQAAADSWSDVFHQISPDKCKKLDVLWAEMEQYTWPKIPKQNTRVVFNGKQKVRQVQQRQHIPGSTANSQQIRKGLQLIPLPVVRKYY
jgi:hypothetical protein